MRALGMARKLHAAPCGIPAGFGLGHAVEILFGIHAFHLNSAGITAGEGRLCSPILGDGSEANLAGSKRLVIPPIWQETRIRRGTGEEKFALGSPKVKEWWTTMCDYSLMAVPNRLAREGEELVTHRFPTGSLGLASPDDLRRATTCSPRVKKTLWSALKDFFDPPQNNPVCAVCIPPGARLELEGLPARLQHEFGVGPVEQVTFTQLTAAVNSYRDAISFSNGRRLRLQELREGMRVKVLDLSLAEELDLDVLREERAEFPMRAR
jgi:hypothetical protein